MISKSYRCIKMDLFASHPFMSQISCVIQRQAWSAYTRNLTHSYQVNLKMLDSFDHRQALLLHHCVPGFPGDQLLEEVGQGVVAAIAKSWLSTTSIPRLDASVNRRKDRSMLGNLNTGPQMRAAFRLWKAVCSSFIHTIFSGCSLVIILVRGEPALRSHG